MKRRRPKTPPPEFYAIIEDLERLEFVVLDRERDEVMMHPKWAHVPEDDILDALAVALGDAQAH